MTPVHIRGHNNANQRQNHKPEKNLHMLGPTPENEYSRHVTGICALNRQSASHWEFRLTQEPEFQYFIFWFTFLQGRKAILGKF
jgi:hypothetical protein